MDPATRFSRRRFGSLVPSLSCALAWALVAPGLAAQTLPVPELPPEPTPLPSPTGQQPQPSAELVVESGERSRWEYEAGVGFLWDSNVGFTIPDGPSDGFVFPRAALTRVFVGPRGQLSVGAEGQWTGYVKQVEHNRSYGAFSLEGSHKSSPRTTLSGNASFWRGYSDTSRPLVEQGVLLPLVPTDTITGELGLSSQVGGRTTLRLDGRVYRTVFDDPNLFDGLSVRGTVELRQQVSSRNTLALVYAAEYVVAQREAENNYVAHYGSLQWTRILTPKTGLLVEGGASYTPNPGLAGLDQQVSGFGGVSLSRQLGRSRLTLFVRREVAPAFGTGSSRLETRAGLDALLTLGRDWEIRAMATYVRPDGIDDAVDPNAQALDAAFTLSRRLARRVEASAGWLYRQRGASDTLPEIRGGQAGVSLTLTNPR